MEITGWLHNRFSLISIVSLLLPAMVGCAASITQDELLALMQDGTAPLIADVRSQREYDRDHVPGARHVSFYAIGAGLRELGAAKSDPVVLYCEHGPRAGIAGLTLWLSGYEQVYSLTGHMKDWRAKGYPVEIIVP